MPKRENKPLYAELLFWSDGVLEHWVEDLTEHDKKLLHTVVQPDQTWIWQVRKTGTWFLRWDVDANAGTKESMLECLIRGAQRGDYDWANAQWHLVHCNEMRNGQPYGIVTPPLDVNRLAEQLPRPKPQPVLPGERRRLARV